MRVYLVPRYSRSPVFHRLCPRLCSFRPSDSSPREASCRAVKIGLADDGVATLDAFGLVTGHEHPTVRGTPARSRFLTAVRLRSWNSRPGTPAASHAVSNAPLKSLIGFLWRW